MPLSTTKYDICSRKLTTLSEAPCRVFQSSAVAIGDNVYVLGGAEEESIATLQVYSIRGDSWTTCTDALETPRHGAALVAIGDRMYLLGGQDENGRVLASIEVFSAEQMIKGNIQKIYMMLSCLYHKEVCTFSYKA